MTGFWLIKNKIQKKKTKKKKKTQKQKFQKKKSISYYEIG